MQDMPPNMRDYDETCRTFRPALPDRFNFATDVFDPWAEDRTKLALISVGGDGRTAEKHTFAELKRLSTRFANALLALGAKKGDHAFLMLPRVPEWYVAVLGMFRVGVVPMPATVMCTAHDVGYRMSRGEASIAVTDGAGAAKVDEAAALAPSLEHRILVGEDGGPAWSKFADLVDRQRPTPGPYEPTLAHDPLVIFFTSGTSGMPKMVLHENAPYVMAHRATGLFWHDLRPTDLHWTISDTGWAKVAFGKLFGQWIAGATIMQHNPAGRFDARLTLEMIERFGVSSFCAPPTAFRMLILEDLKAFDLSSVRHCTSAGEPLNPEVIKAWREGTGLNIYDAYGQTETTLLVANFRCNPVRPGSMGRPMPGYDIAILDEAGHEVAAGEEGEIAVRVVPERPIGLFREYWKDPERTARSFKGDFYLTGDRARRDADGYFWFVGRADDVIKSSGYRIGPFEVESALLEHPAVAESGVVGVPDPIRGQLVKAFVVLRPGYAPSDALAAELQAHVKRVTAPYKYPRVVEFVDELPKTISGKILRRELRNREVARRQLEVGVSA